MNYHELFSHAAQFRNVVTFNNFSGFVIAREYLENYYKIKHPDEVTQYNFYRFLLKIIQGSDESIINNIFDPNCVPSSLMHLIAEKLQTFRNIDYLVAYVNRNAIKQVFARDTGEMEDPTLITFHLSSLVGQFMRKFVIAFHMLHFDQISEFINAFYAHYDVVRSPFNPESGEDNLNSFQQVEAYCEDIIEKSGLLGALSRSKLEKLILNLESFVKRYPDMFKARYALHLLAVRRGNLSEAESHLFKAFELAVSTPKPELNDLVAERRFMDGWTRMTLGAADMHYKFNQIPQARCYLNQALAQALETNDVVCLRFVRMAHEVLNPFGEPFKFRTPDPTNAPASSDLKLAELRNKLFRLLGNGGSPKEYNYGDELFFQYVFYFPRVLLAYFNSEISAHPQAQSTLLLDLSFAFSYYGHSIMATTLLQCVINLECLCPCASSDYVLALSISQMARVIALRGLPAVAVNMLKTATESIGLFSERAYFERARVETQLEQSFRMESNLDHCDRLASDLALFCPWESHLRRAKLELRRGNKSLAMDILQGIAERARELRSTTGFDKDEVTRSEKLFREAGDINKDVLIRTLEPPLTGAAGALLLFEIRARIAMSELFACNNQYLEAMKQLVSALRLSQQHYLHVPKNVCIILISTLVTLSDVALDNPLPEDLSIYDVFTEICHQAEPALAKNLINLKMWLLFIAGCSNVKESWRKHLQESAVFFGVTGDIFNLRRIKNILVS
ncbi:unnamed protein product [Rodentolepis nana]|uniref:Anaphase-promoting complex subunit 5 n=1 Tax=Rodentolepis nana TaxID=102285 RepID=A0A0R3TXI5_RODNA|nr:unnamed protein product [Rodentolepis nana]